MLCGLGFGFVVSLGYDGWGCECAVFVPCGFDLRMIVLPVGCGVLSFVVGRVKLVRGCHCL